MLPLSTFASTGHSINVSVVAVRMGRAPCILVIIEGAGTVLSVVRLAEGCQLIMISHWRWV